MNEKILIVDDDEEVASLLSIILNDHGYETEITHNPTNVLSLIEQSQNKPFSLVLTDVMMPELNGIELLEKIHKSFPDLGVIVVSGNKDLTHVIEAMRKGALDFVIKPFQHELLLSRINRALERVKLEKENREYQKYLEEKVEARTADLIRKHQSLQKLYLNTIEAIARAIEAKDPYTQGHSKRVSRYCAHIAKKMGIDKEEVHSIEVAGLLHDVGKIGISDQILGKPTKLTIEEYEVIKEHPNISFKIIEPIEELKDVKLYVLYHHEKWDGTGYPEQKKGEEIPLGARILSVADAFDTMWIGRQYHAPWNIETVIQEFQRNKDTQFDPKVVDVFVDLIREEQAAFEKIRTENPPRFNERQAQFINYHIFEND